MGKKLSLIAVILCALILIGKVAYDRITDMLFEKGLSMIASSSAVEEFLKDRKEFPVDIVAGNEDSGNETGQPEDNQPGTGGEIKPAESTSTPAPVKDKPAASETGKKEANISAEDKAYVMSIYSRYTAAEVGEVSSIMNSGNITPEKKKRAKAIVFSKMTSAEYKKIMQLADKYGY